MTRRLGRDALARAAAAEILFVLSLWSGRDGTRLRQKQDRRDER